jgi:hypothetical protein
MKILPARRCVQQSDLAAQFARNLTHDKQAER